ncbi:MAG: erythromycin esterase family protein [Actinophytocola sp.]|nr:erythromycin esterase family protein [Actinophytocola sp.]
MVDTAVRVAEQADVLNNPYDLDRLLARTSTARVVLIGEASHGTSEFYRWRAELTKRLIAEQGFGFVAVEGDWPDCHRLHCCVRGAPGSPNDPAAVLWGFRRWPRWMWGNEEVAEFASWLRELNTSELAGTVGPNHPVGFHGLDVYSLWDSLDAVVGYLREHRPEHVDTALAASRCFEPYREDPSAYAYATRLVPEACEPEVVHLLSELAGEGSAHAAGLDRDFVARQNAEVVAGAERYYRAMLRGGPNSWNVRDRHMMATLHRLFEAYPPGTKAVVWAHNTHIGDARATDMSAAGVVNIGQLAREEFGHGDVVLVGFGGYRGSVIASDEWGGQVRRLPVPAARGSSIEAECHHALPGEDALWVFGDVGDERWAGEIWDHRAIGVVYHPEREHLGNYVPTVLNRRYDAFIHCDNTQALAPLHPIEPVRGEAETYPVGL